jgi:hypothetical protein
LVLITQLDDGRIEVIFDKPIKMTRSVSMYFSISMGWAKGSEVLVEKNRIVGVRCYPFVWEDFEKSLNFNKSMHR